MWDNIKELIGTSAPVIGTLLGGSAGNAVGELVAKALGVDNSPDAIENALRNNPDAFIKLKELEFSKELAILKAQFDNTQEDNRHIESYVGAQVSEYSNSRNMQIEALKQEDTFSKRFVYYFAGYWALMSTIYIFTITLVNIPESNIRFADTTLGFLLGTVIATLIGFFYGNSIKK